MLNFFKTIFGVKKIDTFAARMKKVLFVILTLSYLVFSVGIINFSMLCLQLNQKADTKSMVMTSKPVFCSKCGKCILDPITQEESGCCKNKTELVKVDLDQSLAKSTIKLTVEQFTLLQAILPIIGLKQVTQTTDVTLANHDSTPLGITVPINILNCVYRI